MWGQGYNVSREVLLAIRQGNELRVHHLVSGFLAALKAQRNSGGGTSSVAQARVEDSATCEPIASQSRVDGGASSNSDIVPSTESAVQLSDDNVKLGTSVWDFACAIQRLSRLPLGDQRAPFWDEVSRLLGAYAPTLEQRELAVLCNAYAVGAPEWLEGALRDALALRACELADDMNPRDLTMIVHGLSRASPGTLQGSEQREHQRATSSTAMAPANLSGRGRPCSLDANVVRTLAAAARRIRLEEDKPEQAALLLNSFVRLRNTSDVVLFGRMFGFAQKTLSTWDSQALALFCNAFAVAQPRARKRTTADGWQAIANRCAAVLRQADGQHLACMAHAFPRVDVPATTVTEFYRSLEELLCSRPRVNDLLKAQDLALVAHGLAWHRRAVVGESTSLAPGDTTGVAAIGSSVHATEWPLEEYIARTIKRQTSQGLALLLDASNALGRGGSDLFLTLSRRLRSQRVGMQGQTLALACRATADAAPVVGLQHAAGLLRDLRGDCRKLAPRLGLRQAITIAASFADVAAQQRTCGESKPILWRSESDLHAFIHELREVAVRSSQARSRLAVVEGCANSLSLPGEYSELETLLLQQVQRIAAIENLEHVLDVFDSVPMSSSLPETVVALPP